MKIHTYNFININGRICTFTADKKLVLDMNKASICQMYFHHNYVPVLSVLTMFLNLLLTFPHDIGIIRLWVQTTFDVVIIFDIFSVDTIETHVPGLKY